MVFRQMPSSAVSDLGLHYLPVSHKKDARLIWVKNPIKTSADNKYCDIFHDFGWKLRFDTSYELSASREFTLTLIPPLFFVLKMLYAFLSLIAL